MTAGMMLVGRLSGELVSISLKVAQGTPVRTHSRR